VAVRVGGGEKAPRNEGNGKEKLKETYARGSP